MSPGKDKKSTQSHNVLQGEKIQQQQLNDVFFLLRGNYFILISRDTPNPVKMSTFYIEHNGLMHQASVCWCKSIQLSFLDCSCFGFILNRNESQLNWNLVLIIIRLKIFSFYCVKTFSNLLFWPIPLKTKTWTEKNIKKYIM